MPSNPGPSVDTLLARVPLFSSLNPEEISRIARGMREINATKGDILFHKGDLPTGFHLVAHGQVKLGFTSAQGTEKVIDILGPGPVKLVRLVRNPTAAHPRALVTVVWAAETERWVISVAAYSPAGDILGSVQRTVDAAAWDAGEPQEATPLARRLR